MSDTAVFVETSARLHFGVLDLRGSLGRWFGGLGAAAPAPVVLLSASPAPTLAVEGEDADRAAEFARRFLDYHGLSVGAHVRVQKALPSHAGLGSGTQLALAVGRALAELHHLGLDAPALARAVGRARRSAIGTWTFAHGGLVVEGGLPLTPSTGLVRNSDGCGPLLAHLAFPADWQCVVAVPHGTAGISGAGEEEAFARLPPPPQREVERMAHLVLMALLPAVAGDDLGTFGRALSEIQEITGRWFAAAQGSVFAPGPGEELVRRLGEWGACGVGQSSWGPAVYGIVRGADAARRIADRARESLGADGDVYEGAFRAQGARVWRG